MPVYKKIFPKGVKTGCILIAGIFGLLSIAGFFSFIVWIVTKAIGLNSEYSMIVVLATFIGLCIWFGFKYSDDFRETVFGAIPFKRYKEKQDKINLKRRGQL